MKPDVRFWSHVRVSPAGCWEWLGSKYQGYGKTFRAGRTQAAHRVAYQLLVGAIPAGLHIDHLCRNRCCVNPEHLEPVTIVENARRANPGEHNRVKTHCPQGHPYAGENLFERDGKRCCRECGRQQVRRRRATHKEQQL